MRHRHHSLYYDLGLDKSVQLNATLLQDREITLKGPTRPRPVCSTVASRDTHLTVLVFEMAEKRQRRIGR